MVLAGLLIVAAIVMLVGLGVTAWQGWRRYWRAGELLGFGFLCLCPAGLFRLVYGCVCRAYPLLFAGGL
jgi:hypothetical protein